MSLYKYYVHLFSLVLMLITNALVYGQTQISYIDTLIWEESPVVFSITEQNKKVVPSFESASFKEQFGMLPVYFKQFPIGAENNSVISISKEIYEPFDFDLGENIQFVQDQILIEKHTKSARKKYFSSISIMPIRKNPSSGQLERLLSFKVTINAYHDPAKKIARAKSSGSPNSVLATGVWYKIAVEESGFYMIDKNFLASMGVDASKVDPRNIRIYGNGGGMLPEANDKPRPRNLTENAIIVKGETDGNFNDADFILFYAEGPDKWYYDDSTGIYSHEIHNYSRANHYFLNFDLGAGKRIVERFGVSNPDISINTYDANAFHENDLLNLIQTGKEWYGEDMYITTKREFDFTLPGIITSQDVHLKTRMAARSIGVGSSFTISSGNKTGTATAKSVNGNYDSHYARGTNYETDFTPSGADVKITIEFNRPGSALAWLDYIELNAKSSLSLDGDQFHFRNAASIGVGDYAEYSVKNMSSDVSIYDVTYSNEVSIQKGSLSGSTYTFTAPTDTLREFICVKENRYLIPTYVGGVENQNIVNADFPQMIIVTAPEFLAEANELASLHLTEDGIHSLVATTSQVYNEFSSGTQDLTAIRDMVKMFYDRAGGSDALMPKYLMLVGSGSYDYKDRVSGNTNFVPTYQSEASIDPVATYCTDDYFGFLDDDEGGNLGANNLLDISIGRLPVVNRAEARTMVDKIKSYVNSSSFGNWRNQILFVADDEDGNIHVNAADKLAAFIDSNHPEFNTEKIYFDAYQQEATPGGSRYPQAKAALNNTMYSGALMVNYTGHGGVNGWAHERVLDMIDINSWENINKLPLFVTATCEFSRFDDPDKSAAGVRVLLNPNGGAIALMTTVRLVYSSSNENINKSFFNEVFVDEDRSMGDIIREAKNASLTGINNRKFTLLGDPALKIAFPKYEVKTTQITTSEGSDTLKALSKVTVTGKVTDSRGNLLKGYNGVVYPTIYDKPLQIKTLKNDPSSKVKTFSLQNSIIYKGKASVNEGLFEFTFYVPKDITYSYGNGKISYYAENEYLDANGYDQDFVIGGTATNFEADNEGPEISIFMDNESFVYGGMTNESPLLIVKLKDVHGINTVGNGVGHDLTAVLDNESNETYVLNQFYESDLDDYSSGEVRYPLADLKEGRHYMKVTAWDVYNNPGEGITEFLVINSENFRLEHVLNYPNPFTTNTDFWFEHNKSGQVLDVQVRVYSISGKIVKTINTQILSEGNRVDEINWNGLDDFGDRIGKGVYVYKLTVRSEDGDVASAMEKLVILR